MSIPSPSADAPLMLSVSGARGIVGRSMTPEVATDLALAFASHLRAITGLDAPLVCVGRDSRPSGEELAAAAVVGLAAVGCRIVDLGLVTTPTAGVMVDAMEAAGGIVITASHNPDPWNGLKFLGEGGVAPSRRIAEEIIRRYRERDMLDAHRAPPAIVRDDTGTRVHVERALRVVDVDRIRAASFHVVLDSVHGAGGPAARMVLDALGTRVTHLDAEPTGRFTRSPEPIEENLTVLAARTAEANAAGGFAQDPDADRLAIVDERGRYIGEEYTLVLVARRLLDRHGAGVLVTNLSTSRMIDDLAAAHPGSRVLRTAVGEANVVEAMRDASALVGGEGNGGVIVPTVGWVRDSIAAIALVLDLLAAEGRPLSALVDEVPRYHMIKRKIDLDRTETSTAAVAALRDHYADERVDTADGIRVDLDRGWAHVRASNTEPVMRVIVEASTEEDARELLDEVAEVMGRTR